MNHESTDIWYISRFNPIHGKRHRIVCFATLSILNWSPLCPLFVRSRTLQFFILITLFHPFTHQKNSTIIFCRLVSIAPSHTPSHLQLPQPFPSADPSNFPNPTVRTGEVIRCLGVTKKPGSNTWPFTKLKDWWPSVGKKMIGMFSWYVHF